MKLAVLTIALGLPFFAMADNDKAPLVYINQNIGFNVEGYNYVQSEFPCDINRVLVKNLIEKAKTKDITLEPVGTAAKINNGVVPVLAIDVEQLILGEKKFGAKRDSKLPKVQITAALIKGKEVITAKHTCAIMTLNDLTPSSDVLDMGSTAGTATVCAATRKCLKDLSKDVVEWIEPQI